MPKLLIVPGACDALGGTLVSLSLAIQGFEQCEMQEALKVLVQKGSKMEHYLEEAGQGAYLQLISASDKQQYFQRAIDWVHQQPIESPLLLDNCVYRPLLPILITSSVRLRRSNRPIYHFCHDLAVTNGNLKNLLRKFAFTCLAPQAICNSHFTVQYIRRLMPDVRGVLYQPVDFKRFNSTSKVSPPAPLQPILASGAKIILTPSRINHASTFNDKNLRALIPVLAELKAKGYNYHGVIIGEDLSSNKINTQELLLKADIARVSDRLTVLSPVFEIENYYKHADVVVTLAPREPFGRVVVEAIACGVPVVGSCTGGIGEILNQAAPKWQVDPEEPIQAAKKIIELENTLETEKELSQAQAWVEEKCSLIEYAQKMAEITGLKP